MSVLDIILAFVLLIILGLAIRGTHRRRKRGGCSCAGGSCDGQCASCGGCSGHGKPST